MSRLLLDTHVLVWLLAGNPRLGTKARLAIQSASADGALHVSAITPWEIAVLVSKGRLNLDKDVGDWIDTALTISGIALAPLSPGIGVASTRLPGDFHADPADRIIAATARHLGATLVTADNLLLQYGERGFLKVLKAEN